MFTQNTDDLFFLSGIDEHMVVHAHGTGWYASCAVCGEKSDIKELNANLRKGEVLYCKKCTQPDGSGSPIKPGVVFFNESLPKDFYSNVKKEALSEVDLLLILGTTLRVRPFGLITN